MSYLLGKVVSEEEYRELLDLVGRALMQASIRRRGEILKAGNLEHGE